MNFTISTKAQQYLNKTKDFIEREIEPIEIDFWREAVATNHGDDWENWRWPAVFESLKEKARAENLWNMFLPDDELGQGLSVQEYAHIAETSGRSLLAPYVFNCSAPDSGNMEVLWRYGSKQQQEKWLKPLLAGEIRSVFGMTEPDVASSDATNMQATATVEGDQIVLNGRKWWTSGLGEPTAKIMIFMALTADKNKDRLNQHSMVLVPLDTPGVKITRMLPVFGNFDAPHGHGELVLENVKVPVENFIGGAGQGFAIAQGRLGPGRIHHCMRCIGAAEKSLELMIERGLSRVAFGKEILKLGGNFENVATARLAIDQARLLTLYAAWKMDTHGTKAALTEISAIKVAAPQMLQMVSDMAMQIYGGKGVCADTLLPAFFAQARMLRLADGPDEVHNTMIAKLELKKHLAKKQ